MDQKPFRGSEAVRAGTTTWGVLNGPRYRRLGKDTFVATGVPDSPLLAVRAAMVSAGPGAVATGWSACTVLGLDVASRPRPVELATDRQFRPPTGVVARRQRLPAADIQVHDGVRVTTPLRTAFDLASRSGADPLGDAVAAADALARRGGFDGARLASFARGHRGARGVRLVPAVADLLDPRSDSPPESRLRVAIVTAGLPRPVVRHQIRDEIGVLHQELDLAWPRFGVAVEYDGKDHARRDRRGRDIDRLDALRRDGWLVIVVTALQAARPTWVPDRVREALLSRGWAPSVRAT